MTEAEILKKAIEKAVKNGYEFDYDLEATQYNLYYYAYIFSHSFAKAFWGEQKHKWIPIILDPPILDTYRCDICDERAQYENDDYCWQYHLQQMVLEEHPLKYIERFLEKKEEKKKNGI